MATNTAAAVAASAVELQPSTLSKVVTQHLGLTPRQALYTSIFMAHLISFCQLYPRFMWCVSFCAAVALAWPDIVANWPDVVTAMEYAKSIVVGAVGNAKPGAAPPAPAGLTDADADELPDLT